MTGDLFRYIPFFNVCNLSEVENGVDTHLYITDQHYPNTRLSNYALRRLNLKLMLTFVWYQYEMKVKLTVYSPQNMG